MEPTRILPDLQCSLPCEDVRQEITGNFVLVGVLGLIRVTKLPVTATKLCLFNRWTAGLGEFTETARLLAPDQSTLIRQSQVKFRLPEVARHTTNVSIFGQLTLRESGCHYIEVLVDDVMKTRYPLAVKVVAPGTRKRIRKPGPRPE